MITICPRCSNSLEVDEKKKNSRVFCSQCNDFFVAYEAVECSHCRKSKHPNHPCKCGSNDKLFQLSKSLPEIKTFVPGLPDEVQKQLENIFSAVKERIENLENRISDLEDEIEDLKDQLEE